MAKFLSVVRFKVKPGNEQSFIDSMKKFSNPDGVITRKVIKTGERSYCSVVEWVDENSLANARQQMIAYLDTIRDILEELSSELGVTDPVSGPVIVDEQGNVVTPGSSIQEKLKLNFNLILGPQDQHVDKLMLQYFLIDML